MKSSKFHWIPMHPILSVIIIITSLSLISCGESLEERGLRLDRQASEQFSKGNYGTAISLWKTAIDLGFQQSSLLCKTGEAYLHLADYDRALEAYENALNLSPDSRGIILDIGRIHLVHGNYPAAAQIWERLKRIGHPDSDGLIFHGDLLLLKGDMHKAEIDYRQALAIDSDNDLAMIKLAACLIAQGKQRDADKVYGVLAATDPQDALILKQMGNYWDLADNFPKAEAMYLKAIDVEPDNMDLKLALAGFYFDNKRYEKTIDVLNRWISDGADTISGKVLIIEALLALGDLARADMLLSDLIIQKPNNIELQILRGQYYLMAGNPGLAISHFESAVDKEPQMALAHYLLGISCLGAGHNNLGQQSLIKALSIDNAYTDAELALADLFYKQFDYSIALEYAGRVATRKPDNFRAQQIIGNVYLALGQYEKALVSFQKARMIRPGAISPLFFAAVVTEKSGELEKAAQLYERIIAKRPEMVDVAKRYTELLVRTGGAEKAKAFLLQRLKDKRDDSGFTEFMLGKIYLGLNDIDTAKSYFRASVTKNPENPAGFMELADVAKSAGTLEDRISNLRQAIKHNPKFSTAYVDLASSYLAGGDADQAISILEEALTTNPDDPLIQNNLASLYLNLNGNDKLTRAFELVQDAYQKLATEPSINDTLGWAYYRKGFLKQAEWYIREAQRLAERPAADADRDTELKKDAPIVLYHLGVVLHAKGDDIEAQENLERALATGLKGELQADAQRILGMRLKGSKAP